VKVISLKIMMLVMFLATLSGCITTTSLYGNTFQPVGDDVYTLKVMYGGNEFRTEGIDKKARQVVLSEAKKFIETEDEYSSYEIVEFKRVLVPSYLLYRVKFAAK
jgi:hypothetical protein